VLLLKGIEYAQESVLLNERSNSVWAPYVWPAKLFIPIGAFLILLQGLVKTTDDMVLLLTGKPLLKKVEEESDLPETMI
jgi:TRAP-type mannitol/chloroaromatic compound transport system permease small subunit